MDNFNWGEIKFPQTKFSQLLDIFPPIIEWIGILAIILAVIAIMVSGIQYILSFGNPEKAQLAKKNLVWAITGIIIGALAGVIILLVRQVIGSTP